MMRIPFAVLAAFFCGLSVHAGQLKPVATVRLPCESQDQSVSPNGEQVAVRCADHSLQLLDVATGRAQRVFPAGDRVNDYSFSRDGRWFAVGLWDGTVEIMPASGSGEPQRWKASARRIDALEFIAESNRILVAGIDEPGQIWDLSGTPKVLAGLHSNFAGLIASAVSPDGKFLAAAFGDTMLRVYDTGTWMVAHEYRGLTLETFALTFTSDGQYLLAGGADDHISVIDLLSGAEAHRLGGEPGVVAGIIRLGDSGRAAALYYDADTVKPPHQVVWNLETLKAEPLTAERSLTGGGLVHDKLWVASATGTSLQIWEYQ
jgi:WD40 repeat protein